MKQLIGWVLVSGLALLLATLYLSPADEPPVAEVAREAGTETGAGEMQVQPEASLPAGGAAEKMVLDISVHTVEGLKVLFDRAEQLAMTPRPEGADASLVLVLHGPEVEFFSIKNYEQYRDIVDQAARLDAFDVVDLRICQTMIGERGIERTDIPSFIEQVPYGPGEVQRLQQEGYVRF